MSAKDDFDLFDKVAEMLGLEDDEHESFISSAMKRRGHKPSVQWTDSEGDGKNSGGDFFSSKPRANRTREAGRNADRGWQYK